jgi:phage FluMu protein Com
MFQPMANTTTQKPTPTRLMTRSNTVSKFVCKYCHKSLLTEASYLSHKCKQMKRFEEFQSPTGQAAAMYYQRWMRVQKRSPPSASAFMDSKYFRTFINFTIFAAKVSLPTPDKFIWLMVEKKYPPTMWTLDAAYMEYIDFLDRKTDPKEQAARTIEALFNIADEKGCDISEVFKHMMPMEVIHLVRVRKLSPWLLLHSTQFKLFFRDNISPEQKIILETLINPEYWIEQFEDKPEGVEIIKKLVSEMGI